MAKKSAQSESAKTQPDDRRKSATYIPAYDARVDATNQTLNVNHLPENTYTSSTNKENKHANTPYSVRGSFLPPSAAFFLPTR